MINYTEFLAAAVSLDKLLSDEQLWSLFRKFDIDNSGDLSIENLREAFNRMGRTNIAEGDLEEIIAKHANKDNRITFANFRAIFTYDPAKAERYRVRNRERRQDQRD